MTLLLQEGEADDLDLALVKRNESVTDEEEVNLCQVASIRFCNSLLQVVHCLPTTTRNYLQMRVSDQQCVLISSLSHVTDAAAGARAKREAANRPPAQRKIFFGGERCTAIASPRCAEFSSCRLSCPHFPLPLFFDSLF